MADFQSDSNRFLAWFKENGGVFRNDLLQIRDLRSKNAGRGISTLNIIAAKEPWQR